MSKRSSFKQNRPSLTNRTLAQLSVSELVLLELGWILLTTLTSVFIHAQPWRLFLLVFCWIMLVLMPLSWLICRRKKQPVPVQKKTEPVPDLPLSAHPAYMEKLHQIESIAKKMQGRRHDIQEFLNSCFSGSVITRDRYSSIISDSIDVLQINARKARQAVRMFGSETAPTPERLAILDAYLDDSKDLENRLNRIIDELLKMQQKTTLADSNSLDDMLTSLKETAASYTSAP